MSGRDYKGCVFATQKEKGGLINYEFPRFESKQDSIRSLLAQIAKVGMP